MRKILPQAYRSYSEDKILSITPRLGENTIFQGSLKLSLDEHRNTIVHMPKFIMVVMKFQLFLHKEYQKRTKVESKADRAHSKQPILPCLKSRHLQYIVCPFPA